MKSEIAESFTPIDLEIRTAVKTAAAAYYLCRHQQTLRSWASKDNGPLRPIRINGRLAWPVSDIRRLLGRAPSQNTNHEGLANLKTPHFGNGLIPTAQTEVRAPA
jgi:hypothetical protein